MKKFAYFTLLDSLHIVVVNVSYLQPFFLFVRKSNFLGEVERS